MAVRLSECVRNLLFLYQGLISRGLVRICQHCAWTTARALQDKVQYHKAAECQPIFTSRELAHKQP